MTDAHPSQGSGEASPVLELHNIRHSYTQPGTGDREWILKGVDLCIHRGESVGINGPSGCGKSTLLHVLAGLDEVDSGVIKVIGSDLTKSSSDERAQLRLRGMGFVYQAHHLLPEFSAVENVAMPLRLQGASATESARVAGDLLIEIGLAEISIREKIGCLGYSPLASGYLSGKYRNGNFPKGSRMERDFDFWYRYRKPNVGKIVEEYYKISKKYGLDISQMSIKFCEVQDFMTSVIIGATTMEQLKTDIESVKVKLDENVIKEINEIQKIYPNPCP
mgnify:CR=1 FL=1